MRTNNEDLLEIDGVRATVDLSSSQNLKPIWTGQSKNLAVQLVFTGTPAGNFKLQGSCDLGRPDAASEATQYASVTVWTDIPSTGSGAISAAGNYAWNLSDVGYQWVRVVWTATGPGTTPVLTAARAVIKGR